MCRIFKTAFKELQKRVSSKSVVYKEEDWMQRAVGGAIAVKPDMTALSSS